MDVKFDIISQTKTLVAKRKMNKGVRCRTPQEIIDRLDNAWFRVSTADAQMQCLHLSGQYELMSDDQWPLS
jgi:hypothetical protein